MPGPKTPEEALAHIKEAAAEGTLQFASDSLVAPLNAEIQEIFAGIYTILKGCPPKRECWVSDGAHVGGMYPPGDEAGAIAQVSKQLGIPLSGGDLWLDAALRLRDHRRTGTRAE